MKLEQLEQQLVEMEGYTKFLTRQDADVSKAPLGWHLAHNLKVINSIITGLEHSQPAAYKKTFSWKKELVYFFGRIPRGKAKAPKTVLPAEELSEEKLQEEIKITKSRILSIKNLPKNAFFEHPYFGHIKRDETPKFLAIHTEHHLKIMREILAGKK